MIFEHLAAFFLHKYLGNYVEDFHSHKLKISLWNGMINTFLFYHFNQFI
jgi:hypothetical protein